MSVRYASLKHNLTNNLGDEIQTIATDRFLPQVDLRLERDRLSSADCDEGPCLLILNGWFSHRPEQTFPLAACLRPVITGLHITPSAKLHMQTPAVIEYLKKYGPVGCRDRHTCDFLKSLGVDAFYSKCMTLTFPLRKPASSQSKIIVVDVDPGILPRRIRRQAMFISHLASWESDHFAEAERLLTTYRKEARLVITRRLHCALPCVAMGVPVVFFSDPHEYRVSVAADIGLKVHRIRPFKLPPGVRTLARWLRLRPTWERLNPAILRWYHRFIEHINYTPDPIDFEAEKATMTAQLRSQIEDRVAELS